MDPQSFRGVSVSMGDFVHGETVCNHMQATAKRIEQGLGCFEVIVGESVVAFRREDATDVPSSKCFGFVQTYDEKPRGGLWELLKSQESQQVVCMSGGSEDVRRMQQYQ